MQLNEEQQSVYSSILHRIINSETNRDKYLILGESGTGKTYLNMYMYQNLLKDIELIYSLQNKNIGSFIIKNKYITGISYNDITVLENLINKLPKEYQTTVNDIHREGHGNLNFIDNVTSIDAIKKMSTNPKFLIDSSKKFFIIFGSDKNAVEFFNIKPGNVFYLNTNNRIYKKDIKNLNDYLKENLSINKPIKIVTNQNITRLQSSTQYKEAVTDSYNKKSCYFLVKNKQLAKLYDTSLAKFFYKTESFLELSKNTPIRVNGIEAKLKSFIPRECVFEYLNGITRNAYTPTYKYTSIDFNKIMLDFGFVYTLPEVLGNTFKTAFIVLDQIESVKELYEMTQRITDQIYFIGDLNPKIGIIYDSYLD